MSIQQTLVLLKPDAVQRGLIGQIITRFENAGIKMIAAKLIWIDSEFSKKHYEEHVEKEFYKGLEEMITEGPVFAMVLEGIEIVEIVRKMAGETEPKSATPGTIRADFAQHSYKYADQKGIGIKNLIHASATEEEAKKEIKLWFKPEEIHTYQTVHEKHVF